MVSDHEKDIDEFQEYVDQGKDPDLTSFAGQSLPMLQQHLQLAQQTEEQVTAAASQGEPSQAAARQPQQAVSIEKALGSPVVNATGEEVGKIEDVVLDQTGKYYAVLSVGGFLGVGDKNVAMPLDELQLGEGEAYHLMTAQTEDQLEQMPEYDEDQYQPYAQQ